MQLYTPADVFADLQSWCYEPGNPKPDLPDRAWYVLQGKAFGSGFDRLLPYLRYGNERYPGIRLIIYDAVTERVCAVGMWESHSGTDWCLTYYFADTGARKVQVFEAAQSTIITWLVTQATHKGVAVRLTGELACAEDACQLAFSYRAMPNGRLWVEHDEVRRW